MPKGFGSIDDDIKKISKQKDRVRRTFPKARGKDAPEGAINQAAERSPSPFAKMTRRFLGK